VVFAVVGFLALAAFVATLLRPQFGAYLWLLANPLVVGIARGDYLPVLRPNEALLLLIVAALATRAVLLELAGHPLRIRFDQIDLVLILLAVTSSILPMLMRYGRGLPVSQDDILYAFVLWKYYVLFRVFRGTVTTVGQVATCLWISLASGLVVALVGLMQVWNLFGVPEFLHTYYDNPFEGHSGVLTERGTSTISSSFGFADLMIMNLVIAAAMVHGRFGGTGRLALAGALFLAGCIAAGAFSGFIALAVAMLAFGLITKRLVQMLLLGTPAAIAAVVALWPVVSKRMSGFERPEGVPHSWTGRWANLETFFFPELLSGLNWLVGVRPAPRVPAPETWREYVYIESGYVWLFWIGGVPLFAAFLLFLWVSGRHLLKVVRARADEVSVAATATLAFLCVMAVLMLLDPHLTVRGSADLFFPLLALSLVRPRDAVATRPAERSPLPQPMAYRMRPSAPGRRGAPAAGTIRAAVRPAARNPALPWNRTGPPGGG